MLWDFWYDRVYSCTKITGAHTGSDTYICKRFYSVEAANMYMRLNDVPLLYMCRFTPLVMDSTILKFKLKENVVFYN